METIKAHKINSLTGTILAPGDKSISHRAVILGSLAQGNSTFSNFCPGDDTFRTIQAFRALGVTIEADSGGYVVYGKGLTSLQEPPDVIDAGNSGTTIRLLTGLLSGQNFFSVLTGDDSLRKRPMKRVTVPLRQMGATIDGRMGGDYAPLTIRGGKLTAIQYISPVSSAQIKSALILAGLFSEGITQVTEPTASRDHTERMLRSMGANLDTEGTTVRVTGFPQLEPFAIQIPGDISSAAFFLVGATIVPGSRVMIRNVGVNPLRAGVLEVLNQMGANIEMADYREEAGEPRANLVVSSSPLKAVEIGGDLIPRLIDEIPILAIAAARAEGTTVIRDAKELRVKETDRIAALVNGLRKMGVEVEEFGDGMAIKGARELKGAKILSYGDHRIAMSFFVAGLVASGKTEIQDTSCISTSYPQFMETIRSLSR